MPRLPTVRRMTVTDTAKTTARPPLLPERFWAKVEKTTTCWLWRGSTNGSRGYGQIWWGGRLHPAHRISYEMVNGSVPVGLELDHLCRTRACVRPDHLEAVSHSTNMKRASDTIADARALWQARGSQHGSAKLTEATVVIILEHLAAGASCFSLASQYGINRSNIQRIRNGITWRHVARPAALAIRKERP